MFIIAFNGVVDLKTLGRLRNTERINVKFNSPLEENLMYSGK